MTNLSSREEAIRIINELKQELDDEFSWLDTIDDGELESEYKRWLEETNNNLTRKIKMKKCNCGVAKAGGGKHSDWCDAYEEEKDAR